MELSFLSLKILTIVWKLTRRGCTDARKEGDKEAIELLMMVQELSCQKAENWNSLVIKTFFTVSSLKKFDSFRTLKKSATLLSWHLDIATKHCSQFTLKMSLRSVCGKGRRLLTMHIPKPKNFIYKSDFQNFFQHLG